MLAVEYRVLLGSGMSFVNFYFAVEYWDICNLFLINYIIYIRLLLINDLLTERSSLQLRQ